MPRAYSDDLRCQVLQAYERTGAGLEDLVLVLHLDNGQNPELKRVP